MKLKKTILAASAIAVIAIICNGCATDRRWYSTYTDENNEKKTEHYNGYRKKWYRKNWNNRRMWK